MAQKINSINLRLNKRFNWNSIVCTHDFNDYSNVIINIKKLLTKGKKLIYDLKLLQNITFLTKTSKNYKFHNEIIDQRFFFIWLKC